MKTPYTNLGGFRRRQARRSTESTMSASRRLRPLLRMSTFVRSPPSQDHRAHRLSQGALAQRSMQGGIREAVRSGALWRGRLGAIEHGMHVRTWRQAPILQGDHGFISRGLSQMNISGNTILITGGGSGIGRGLAEAFHAKGNQVVIAGRRKNLLDETVAANPGMKAAILDIENSETIRTFAEKLKKDFPTLNVVIHNAGIMKPESLKDAAV